MASVALAHLLRANNGLAPFEAFLSSYRAHDAGCEHRLVILAKGFTDASFQPYGERLAGLDPVIVRLPDEGFDVGPYREVTRRLRYDTWCFVNSFSIILVDGWLAHLINALRTPGVGLVGATGSHASHASMLRNFWGFGGPYAPVLRPAATSAGGLAGRRARLRGRLEHELGKLQKVVDDPTLLRKALRDAIGVRHFDAFPSPHIRTNAFAIQGATMNAVHFGAVRTKWDAYRFESARGGLSAQVKAQGYQLAVVDRRGDVHPP